MKLVSVLSCLALLAAPSDAFSMSMNLNPKNTIGGTSKTAGWDLNSIGPSKIRVEGETRHTFSFGGEPMKTVQIAMTSPSERPISTEVNLWLGPDYTPYSLKCHSENGAEYPVQTLIGTKGKHVNVEVKNVGVKNFPINCACSYAIPPLSEANTDIIMNNGGSTYIDGGAIRMYPFSAEVEQLQVLLKTDGKLLKARIELLNGPNNIKQEYEVYASSGDVTSMFVVFETSGDGNSIRVQNLASQEYPLDFYWRASKMGKPDDSLARWN